MTVLLIAYIAHVVLVWHAYGPLGRVLSLVTLGLASAPFLVAAAGLAGDASGDARRLLWVALVVWTLPTVVVEPLRHRRG